MENTEIEELKQRMSQQARAGLPFNPLTTSAITGANVDRLQKSMDSFGWTDHRFVTEDQSKANGLSITPDAENVKVSDRDEKSGTVTEYALYNASTVLGMPTLDAMLQMDNVAFLAMRGIALAPSLEVANTITETDRVDVDVRANANEAVEQTAQPDVANDPDVQDIVAEDDDIEVGPARSHELAEKTDLANDSEEQASDPELPATVEDLFLNEPVQDLDPVIPPLSSPVIDWADEPDPSPEQYAVSAPYWLDGLHNFEGLKLAEEINQLIDEKKLAQSKYGINGLLDTYPDKLKFGLSVVDKEKHEKDPHRKANQAEPATLLKGALVRDKEGKYRPKEGGLPIIEDNGSSLKLKRKNGKAYEAAMELALAKGWKSIELNGKPKMLGQAWLEAKMKGLEVVNYTPTEKDREALAQRIAERDAAIAKEQSPETVEVRPVIDGEGREVMAKVTTTVEQQGTASDKSAEPVASGKPLQQSTITRTTTRLNDVVRTDVQPGVTPKGMRAPRKGKDLVQREIAEAVAEEKSAEVGGFDIEKGGTLVEQGTAPYNHNPNAKASPYAVLVNDEGVPHTFWGQDLPRSIQEAGAEVGDTVSLIAGERTPVSVPVQQPDGTTRNEIFNRVSWEAHVLAKAKTIDSPAVEAVLAVDKGMHIGPVMAIKDGKIGQKTGRDPNKLVWHEISKLEGKVPGIGEMAEIGYSMGKGKVLAKELERGVSR